MSTRIEWTDETWNPVTGCTKISAGCANCYAERMAKRLAGRYGYPADEPFRVTCHPERLEEPLRWKKPRRVFVCSMSDLFHEDVPCSYRTEVFDVMATEWAERHVFQVLTKRPYQIKRWESWVGECWPGDSAWNISCEMLNRWPDNIWLGVTAENQENASLRIPQLLQTAVAVRFVSVEPMLGPIELAPMYLPGYVTRFAGKWTMNTCTGQHPSVDWVIIGCESGPGRRPMKLDWVSDLVGQCRAAFVPVFVKQLPIDGRVSHDPSEWPEELRVREYPRMGTDKRRTG